MLGRLQQQLTETYQAPVAHDVRDYLITDPVLASLLGGENVLTSSGESLLVSEDEDGLALSLYLEQEILHRLESLDPAQRLREEQLNDLCKVIEGVSHFNYVVWRAQKDQSMTLLELELQAEIDKYVSTMQMALEQRDHDMLHELHGHLFDNYRLRDDLDQDQVERYRAASEFAARFCRRLRRRMLQSGDGALAELRRFYRMSLSDKISHIRSRSFGNG
jgi:hypothetical protein